MILEKKACKLVRNRAVKCSCQLKVLIWLDLPDTHKMTFSGWIILGSSDQREEQTGFGRGHSDGGCGSGYWLAENWDTERTEHYIFY